MKPIAFWLAVILYLATLPLQAQKIFFTTHYDSSGNARGSSADWKIDPLRGSFVYVLFKDSKPLESPKLYLFIDRVDDSGAVAEFATYKVNVQPGRDWAAYKCLFTEEGLFTVGFADERRKMLVADTVRIAFRTKLIFAESMAEGEVPQRTGRIFRKSSQEPMGLYIYLKNTSALNTSTVVAKIYRIADNEQEKLIEVQRFSVQPEWTYTYLRYLFRKAGSYKIELVDEADRVLGSDSIEISD